MRFVSGGITAVLLGLAVQGVAAPMASAADSPAVAEARKLQLPDVTKDINDWSCRAEAGKEPVVMVHGTFGLTSYSDEDPLDRWGRMAEPLKKDGHCVYALQYGVGLLDTPGVTEIEKSAAQLKTFVDGVKESSGASKVKLVSHSQGGLVSRYYLKDLGGTDSANALIGLGTPNRGTEYFAAKVGALVYPAVKQMLPDSDFLKKLNSGGDLRPGVAYTMIATEADETVTPYTSAHLQGPASQLTNVTLGGKNPPSHDYLPNSAEAIAWVREAVRSDGPASPSFRPGQDTPDGTPSATPSATPSGTPSAAPGEGSGGSGGGDTIDAPLAEPTVLAAAVSVVLLAGAAFARLGNRRSRSGR
ncbi:alpha/beta fold hydrolase [Streptoverticillium reticulum]|uniref:alpha/beta fold hydrolase n=1 Tax=Streptoverticillium reticulum TaxID=1433415 RepID=UPI0039BEEBDD